MISVKMQELNFQVNCRDCGQPMQLASKLLQTVLYCKRCKLKAVVSFEKIVKLEVKSQ